MKCAVRLALAAILVVLLIVPVEADELYGADDFDIDAVLDALPSEVREKLPERVFDGEGFADKFSFEYFFELLRDALVTALSPMMKTLCTTLGLVLIASALSALRGAIREGGLGPIFEFASGLCIMLTLYNTAVSLVNVVQVYLAQLSNIVSAMVPVTIAIGTAGGNISSSAVSGSAMMLGLAFVEALAKDGLYPILQLCFGLAIASGIGTDVNLGGISKTVRSAFTWVLGLVSALISAVMTFQTSIAARADSLSMRAIKFAAANSVPVVGGIASDAVSAVAASLSLVKSTVGWVGVIIIIILTVPVIANIIMARCGVVISEIAADVLGLEREKRLLCEISGLFGSLAAVCVIAALMFVYALAVFAKSAVAFA